MVLGILNGGEFPAALNSTHIVLIPKKKAPDKFVDYRPISLCNVLYKLISKVLENHLKLFLARLVSENQSAFTPGRMISDNIMIAFEMFYYMKNSRGGGGHMALKLDMAKAYDHVEWVFLRRVLVVIGFDGGWVYNVMSCVESVSFEVLINGSPSNVSVPERELRQGDPFSPYLFIICAEVLSSLIRRKVEVTVLHGIQIAPQAPIICHLFFADDSIIFVKANENQAREVLNILTSYEEASGQLVSKEKTTVSFSRGTRTRRKELVAVVLGVQVVSEQAALGSNPSYTWGSVCEAKTVLDLGLRRCIGNGESIRVWLDPWIPGTETRRVLSPRGEVAANLRVSELMVEGEVRWDRNKVETFFLPFEAKRVMQIRLSELPRADDWCWDHEKNAEYTLKSGYRLLFEKSEVEGEQSDFTRDRWLWKAIWRVPVIPRIKAFMWQLCNDALPTKANIAARLGLADGSCPRCPSNMETCLHVVRGCGWGDEIWEAMSIEVDRNIGIVRVREWVEDMSREMEERERVKFMTICSVIWEKRNKMVFERERWLKESVIRRRKDLIWEMKSFVGW
ncbi:uncharacterized protein LOC141639533 [Silene latifolia]|uniref:uncharacterized protein LOC141639533 n=1 Tax=Silene latifolia TaxID=37657 RepID=UPI003D775E9E